MNHALLLLGLGLGLGAISSMLPGPCYLAVLTAAARRGRTRALATGLGAALGDASYAALGATGVGLALTRPPAGAQALQLVGALGLIAYGWTHARAHATATPVPVVADRAPPAPTRVVAGGFATGLATVLVNPGALLTWIVLVGATLSGAPAIERAAGVIGIGLGSFGSYVIVAHWGAADLRAARLTRVVGRLLVALGALALARVGQGWLS